jgi:3-oxoacyl-[acyl-carrier-protein] synthase II
LDLHGEVTTISNACAAGNYAIGHAFDLISSGEADFMVCGGTDSVCRKNYAGFFKLGAITPTVVRPFDLNRQGILTGEGSGMLFLETLESAQQRGAYIYAEVLGYGLTSDANQMVVPDPGSIARCIRLAHAHAGITPDQVDYVCAHGTGTKVNDVAETAALRAAFGDRLPPTSSIKSMIGHTMGAASALGAIACALAITQEFLPPTINFETPDPECVIDCIPNQARGARPNVVENHGFAFGGHNAIVILGRESWNTARMR